MPQALQDRPELSSHLLFVWEAFLVLSKSRSLSDMGQVMGILPSETIAYLTWLGVEKHLQPRVFSYINALDEAYLQHVRAEGKKRRPQQK